VTDAPPQPEDRQEKPPDAVVIHVRRGEGGRFDPVPEVLGDVRPSEVESVLGAALRDWRAANRLPT
jgi:hypothetical protein